ncbi:hypothetical protein KCU81_g108, partial [Aureobasidium melanogenum]
MSLPLVDVSKIDRYSVTGWDFEGMAGGCILPFVQPWLSVSVYYVRIEAPLSRSNSRRDSAQSQILMRDAMPNPTCPFGLQQAYLC